LKTISAELAAAIALGIEPTHPGVIDAYPGHVLLDPATGETWSLDPEDYRWYDGQPYSELRSSMEMEIESAWLNEDASESQAVTRVLVPAHLL